MTQPDRTFDYVVAGGGTAGCIVARRLADAGHRVCLIEAGPSDENLPHVLAMDRWDELLESPLDWAYRIAPQPTGNGNIVQSRGRMLGGSSSHNTLIAFRLPDADLENWVALGAEGWGPRDVEHLFDRVEASVPIERHVGGDRYSEAFLEACAQAGFPTLSFAINPGHVDSAGWVQLNARDGIRQSTSVVYLHPIADLPDSLTVLTDILVHRVLVENGRAVGVETAAGRVLAEREVILAGGVFGSTQMLLLSGIGPADHLRAVGVPVIHDLPGVGEHLIDHVEGVVTWRTRQDDLPRLRANYSDAVVFARLDPAAAAPDIMAHFCIPPFEAMTIAAGLPAVDHGFSLCPNVAHARSEGTVRLRSADSADTLDVDPRYFSDPDGYDRRVIVESHKLMRKIAAQPALARLIEREWLPGPEVADDAAIWDYARRTSNTTYHPAGTCRMGRADDPMAVVDPRLRVRGIEGLRIADGAVFPAMIGVNLNIPTMMIGEKAAELILNG
ncbi:MAG: GMC family oxidoreductase N-terminal domain-containing protein [Proteobacteria bacterium]|nr:GMC family oxidoreductase N-terminal domain-containing protein [Pseudomonadota bacterium]